MILSDNDIIREIDAGNIIFEPPISAEDISPSSVDVHLGHYVSFYKPIHEAVITAIDLDHPDIANVFKELLETIPIPEGGYRLEPDQFVLSQILEKLTLCSTIAARLEGRSTNARFGLAIHSTAPTVHATYSGHLTLEICNFGDIAINLKAESAIGQLIFERLESPPAKTLQSPWQGQ